MSIDYASEPAVNNLREYLRFRTVHPDPNYDECIVFLRRQAAELGLSVQIYKLVPKKPILVMTWVGEEPHLPSILFNSHMDVVPVDEKQCDYPPFEARLVDGYIYGRGAQDTKIQGIQYLEAIRKLMKENIKLKRTIHISFVPDEEIGGVDGMAKFVETDEYKDLNIGMAIDEGICTLGDDIIIFNGSKSVWHVDIICSGKSIHGATIAPDSPGDQLRYIMDKFMDLRKEPLRQLENCPNMTEYILRLAKYISVNLTMIQGGTQNNTVPDKITASFDIRLPPSVDQEEFENKIKQWCKEAGNNVTYEFKQKDSAMTPIPLDSTNMYWTAIKDTLDKQNIKCNVAACFGAFDTRYIRAKGTYALSIGVMRHSTFKAHEINESIHASAFIDGINVFKEIIRALGNV